MIGLPPGKQSVTLTVSKRAQAGGAVRLARSLGVRRKKDGCLFLLKQAPLSNKDFALLFIFPRFGRDFFRLRGLPGRFRKTVIADSNISLLDIGAPFKLDFEAVAFGVLLVDHERHVDCRLSRLYVGCRKSLFRALFFL